MPTVRGKAEVKRFLDGAPAKLDNVLRGAARAGGKVVADEIKATTPSEAVRDGVRTRLQKGDGRIVVRIDLKPGWARSVGTWLEYGTAPHWISVDVSETGGRTARRLNTLAREGDGEHSLVIGGNFVGKSVFHPGADPQPTFRPALDRRENEAVAAAQGYINARLKQRGIGHNGGPSIDEGDDE
ncbi:MAG TPA: HK97 gp10 family phage protein [Allosphingosinicella sp.]|jgi:hypothetical protein